MSRTAATGLGLVVWLAAASAHGFTVKALTQSVGHEFLTVEAARLAGLREPRSNEITGRSASCRTCDQYGTDNHRTWSAVMGNRWADLHGWNVITDGACFDATAQSSDFAQPAHFLRLKEHEGLEGVYRAAAAGVAFIKTWFLKAARAPQESMWFRDGGGSVLRFKALRPYFYLGIAAHALQDSFSEEHTVRDATLRTITDVKTFVETPGAQRHACPKRPADKSKFTVLKGLGQKGRRHGDHAFRSGVTSSVGQLKPTARAAMEATRDLFVALHAARRWPRSALGIFEGFRRRWLGVRPAPRKYAGPVLTDCAPRPHTETKRVECLREAGQEPAEPGFPRFCWPASTCREDVVGKVRDAITRGYEAVGAAATAVGGAVVQVVDDLAARAAEGLETAKKIAAAAIRGAGAAARAIAQGAVAVAKKAGELAAAAWGAAKKVAAWAAGVISDVVGALGDLVCKALPKCRARQERRKREAEAARALAEERARSAQRRADLLAQQADEMQRRALAPKIEAETAAAALDILSRFGVQPFLDCPARRGRIHVLATVELIARYGHTLRTIPAQVRESRRMEICRRYWALVPHLSKAAWERSEILRLARQWGNAAVERCSKGMLGPVANAIQAWLDHPLNQGRIVQFGKMGRPAPGKKGRIWAFGKTGRTLFGKVGRTPRNTTAGRRTAGSVGGFRFFGKLAGRRVGKAKPVVSPGRGIRFLGRARPRPPGLVNNRSGRLAKSRGPAAGGQRLMFLTALRRPTPVKPTRVAVNRPWSPRSGLGRLGRPSLQALLAVAARAAAIERVRAMGPVATRCRMALPHLLPDQRLSLRALGRVPTAASGSRRTAPTRPSRATQHPLWMKYLRLAPRRRP